MKFIEAQDLYSYQAKADPRILHGHHAFIEQGLGQPPGGDSGDRVYTSIHCRRGQLIAVGKDFLEQNSHPFDRAAMFGDRQGACVHRHTVSTLVQKESGAHLRLPLGKRHRYRALLGSEIVSFTVASLHHIFQDMSNHLVREISGDLLRAVVPKTDPPIPVYDVKPQRHVLDDTPEEFRVVEKVRKHDLPSRLWQGAEKRGTFQ